MRTLAFGLDYLIIAAYLGVLIAVFAILGIMLPDLSAALFGDAGRGELSGFVLVTLPIILYFSLSEASDRAATWGKQRLGLRVVQVSGSRMSVGRSMVRAAAKFAPWELAHAFVWQAVFAGPHMPPLAVAGFAAVYGLVGANLVSLVISPRDQALYDRLAGTVVIQQP